jgi:NADPH-dependent 2,4-dienoyl-CoA reductase/sulfur reductase-like enzyme
MRGANLAYVAPAFVPQGPNVPTARAVKAAVGIPVIVAGRIVDFDLAEDIVAAGDADMVGMVRALIADPAAVGKALSGQAAKVVPCIGGNECHYGRAVACAVNAAAGREAEMEIVPAAVSRHILVIGAGPAGLECAAVAAERGHRVTLVDRRPEIGGVLATLSRTAHQADYGKYIDYMRRRIDGLDVEVRQGVEADADFARTAAPDAIVLATGARQLATLPHDRSGSVVDALSALENPEALGDHVAVVGSLDDHLPPLLVADFLARAGRTVTLLTENIAPAPALETASLVILMKRLLERGVMVLTTTAAVELKNGALATRNSLTRAPGRIDGVDSAVLVGGRAPDDRLAESLKPLGIPIHLIGDALSPRRMLHATLDGARLARTLF